MRAVHHAIINWIAKNRCLYYCILLCVQSARAVVFHIIALRVLHFCYVAANIRAVRHSLRRAVITCGDNSLVFYNYCPYMGAVASWAFLHKPGYAHKILFCAWSFFCHSHHKARAIGFLNHRHLEGGHVVRPHFVPARKLISCVIYNLCLWAAN